MATPNLNLTLPTVGADNNNWGADLNNNLTAIDGLWANIGHNAFGTAATTNIGASGAAVPLLSAANTWSGAQTFSGGLSGTLNGNVTGSSGSCTGNAVTATTAGNCSGNAATATTAGSCSGNSATASALTAGNKAINGNLTITGQATFYNDANFNARIASTQYVLQMGVGGINYDAATNRLNIVVNGATVGYFDGAGYTQLV